MRPPRDKALVFGNHRKKIAIKTKLKTTFFGLHFCCRKYRCLFNHFYVMRPESYRIRWNNAMLGVLCRSRSFKVNEFGTNRKLIYDFLLVINTNLLFILHRFRDIALDRSKVDITSLKVSMIIS